MKLVKLFYLLLILIGYVNQCPLNSQSYSPLVKEGATWINYYSEEYPETLYSAYKIEGDTTINSTDYKKLYYYNLKPNQTSSFEIVSKDLGGILREDIIGKKVYGSLFIQTWGEFEFILCDGVNFNNLENEVQLFDFNKFVGDTLNDCHLDQNEIGTIIIDEKIAQRFGSERRVLINENNLELIEGIGYEDGLFMKAHTWVHAGWGYGLFDYCNSSEINCQLITNSLEIPNIILKIYPNPAVDKLFVESPIEIKRLNLKDLNGKLIKSSTQNYILTNEIKNSGLFLLNIELEGNQNINKLINITRR